MTEPRLTVLGIGNTRMGDDGVGPVVARSLVGQLGDAVEVVVGGMAGMQLARYFTSGRPLIVIDAIDAETEAGAIFRFSPDDCSIGSLRSNTLHGHGLPYLVMSARLAGADPDITIYAVQVGDVHPSLDTLSGPVQHAAERVERLIREDVARRLAALDAVPASRGAGLLAEPTTPAP